MVVERGNRPILERVRGVALSEGVQSRNSSSAPGPEKEKWPCDFCARDHRPHKTKAGRLKAFCRSLGGWAYSPGALKMKAPPNRRPPMGGN